MPQPLPQAFADILSRYKSRPFDSAIKETLKESGVLQKLWGSYCTAAAVTAFPDRKELTDLGHKGGVTWLDQEFRTKQATWRADMIARVGQKAMIHVEQQTDHKPLDASRRLMLYSSQIATYFDFKKTVFQLYYYTGNSRMKWESEQASATMVEIRKGAITSKFLALDAGTHDAEGMLESGDFNYAVLGLLSRHIPEPRSYVRRLVTLARSQFDSTEASHKLVHCMTIAFLRGRAELVWEATTMTERNNMRQDPFWKRITDDADRDTRRLCAAIFRTFEDFKRQMSSDLPTEFLDKALEEFNWDDIDRMETNLKTAKTVQDVLIGTVLETYNSRSPRSKPRTTTRTRLMA
ncbi:hypothetical protein ACVITL_003374 [Rhizobium pisi]